MRSFYFVRHGQTDWNARQLCQGQTDIPLNQHGILEAQSLIPRLQKLSISCIVTSPLKRALETAHIIQSVFPNSHLELMSELKERNWGNLEGISSQKMYEIEQLEETNPTYDPGHGVELRSAFRKRILQALHKIETLDTHPLLVSHGRVFLELCYLLELPIQRQVLNCQIVHISHDGDGHKLRVIE